MNRLLSYSLNPICNELCLQKMVGHQLTGFFYCYIVLLYLFDLHIIIFVLCLHKVVGRDHLTEPADAIHHKAKLATALDKS